MKICHGGALSAAILLAGCGKPNASGIYVSSTINEVVMIQLIQTDDGKLTGRLEDTTVGPDGAINNKAVSADGAVSNNDILLRPASVWLGGMQASGSFDRSTLKLTFDGGSLNAERSDLNKYQIALAHLQTSASDKQVQVAAAKAAGIVRQAEIAFNQNISTTRDKIQMSALQIRSDTQNLENGLNHSPNFGQFAKDDTAKISSMMQYIPNISDFKRNQISYSDKVSYESNRIFS